MISFKLKTGQSNGQNWQILQESCEIGPFLSTLKQDKQKCARLFKMKQDEQDLMVRWSNNDQPAVPGAETTESKPVKLETNCTYCETYPHMYQCSLMDHFINFLQPMAGALV